MLWINAKQNNCNVGFVKIVIDHPVNARIFLKNLKIAQYNLTLSNLNEDVLCELKVTIKLDSFQNDPSEENNLKKLLI
ncbi:hypothetical protein T10_3656 [Trichinella papuae]|uniref:Uncharacterized protein n=1 Tax=Trichinella papuae TaxID=268474 RepID=A0A0V1N2N2_9BILA|nr:hypothetical protein T10_3656 [Trichinella papuae]